MKRRPPFFPRALSPWQLCLGITLGVLVLLVLLPLLAPYDPDAPLFDALQPPSWAHLAGTDQQGRDLLSRILAGMRTSVLSTVILVGISASAGTLVGVACGYWGRWLDRLVLALADLCLAFPGLVFALAIAAVLQGGLENAILALAVIGWPKYAKLARNQTRAMLGADYLAAARLAGNTGWQCVTRHILPNLMGTILVTATSDLGTMMMELAGLSFLGLGAQPPTPELGSMMSAGRSMLQTYPWVILGPGLGIFVVVAVFHRLGDALGDALVHPEQAGKDGEETR